MNNDHDRIEALLNQALEFKPEERSAFLAGACGEDDDLRHKVETLLTSEDQASGFMPDPTTLLETTVSEGPGTVVDRYKLLQQIGEGGMGLVYMAQQTEPVQRKVALKIIKLGMDTKSVVARFEAERQALAMMDHPNIARVHDGGATETGRPYFVMELVQGVPITEFCDKNKLPANERLELFIPVCQAIQSAHQKGIIHRDIKPSNVLVTLHHGEPMPKVIDFGIAKATNQKLTEKTLFTNYAQMIGTPAYMSPEQAEMSSMDVDTRTDVYSLGVLLYELLTGTTPLSSKRLNSMAYGEMQRVIVEEEPQKPSTRMSTMGVEMKTVTAKNRGIDNATLSKQFKGDIDWIVMRCLEKDRRRRYDSPKELAEDLKRFQNDAPVSAAAPSIRYQLQKMVRRYKTAFAAAAAIVVILVVGAMVATWQAVRATRANQVAMLLQDEMRKARDQAQSARKDADRRLYSSYIDQARLAQVLNEPGFRTKTESLLKQASALDTDARNELELRNAAIAVMLKPYSDVPIPAGTRPYNTGIGDFTWNLDRHELAIVNSDGAIEVIDIIDDVTHTISGSESDPAKNLAFGRHGNTLFSSHHHQRGVIRIWRRGSSTEWRLERELFIETGGSSIDLAAGKTGLIALIRESNELYYWKDLAQVEPEVQTLPADYHGKAALGLSVSPDERWVAIPIRQDRILLIWDLLNKNAVQRLEYDTTVGVNAMHSEFSPDGSYFAWGISGMLRAYSTDTFELLFEKNHSGGWPAMSFDFSSDSAQLVYGENPAYIHLLAANQPLVTLASDRGRFLFKNSASRLLHGFLRSDGQIETEYWPSASQEFVELVGHASPVRGITFHPTQPLVLTTSEDKTVRFWSLDDGREVQRIMTPQGASDDVMYSPDKNFFVMALDDEKGTVQIRDTFSMQVLKEIEFGSAVRSVEITKSAPLICLGGYNSLKVWRHATTSKPGEPSKVELQLIKEFSGSKMGDVTTVKLSADGRYLAWFETGPNSANQDAQGNNGIRIWDFQKNVELPIRIKAARAWNVFDFVNGKTQIAVSWPEDGLQIWDFLTEKMEHQYSGWKGATDQMDISNDGRFVAFSASPRQMGIIDLEQQKLLFMIPNLSASVWQFRWNEDDSRLGIAEGNGRARVLNITAIRDQLDELGLNW